MENKKQESALDALIRGVLSPSDLETDVDREIIKEIGSHPLEITDSDKLILARIDARLESLLNGIEYVNELEQASFSGRVFSSAMNRNFETEKMDPETENELKKQREALLKKIRDKNKKTENDDN
jgi:hypothetical protein